MIEIRGERVRLRPFGADEVDAVYAAHLTSEAMVGTPKRDAIEQRIARSGDWDEGRLDLAIDLDRELIGSIDVRSGRMMIPPGVCEFGIELWATHRDAGLGTDAVATLTAWLHGQGFARVQAGTAVGNARMRRVLEKAGFAYEGTMRAFMPDGDGRGDYALYAHVSI